MSTFLQLCQDLWLDLGLEGAGPTSVLNQTGMKQRICYWVQQADIKIQNKWLNWNFLHKSTTLTTVVNSQRISSPTGLRLWDIASFFYDDSPLTYVAYDEWRSGYKYSDETGEPWGFSIAPNKEIIIIPTPDAAYAIDVEYWASPQKMTANTSTSLIPEAYERAILAQASLFYAAKEEVQYETQASQQELFDIVTKMESCELPGMGGFATADNDIAPVME